MVLVKLKTNDSVEFTSERTKIRKCKMIINTLDNFASTENPNATPDELIYIRDNYENTEPIHLKLVSKASFDLVMIWCEKYANESDHMELTVSLPEWDSSFLEKLSNRELLEMLISANFLDIPRLRLHIAIKLRDMVRGVGPDEIRRIFAK